MHLNLEDQGGWYQEGEGTGSALGLSRPKIRGACHNGSYNNKTDQTDPTADFRSPGIRDSERRCDRSLFAKPGVSRSTAMHSNTGDMHRYGPPTRNGHQSTEGLLRACRRSTGMVQISLHLFPITGLTTMLVRPMLLEVSRPR